jgi:catechol 2,3-dioxygenase-like lactoylglutathione lyase family enzyme
MSVPFTLKEIDHVVLRTANLERMMAFYCDVLGCTLDRAQEEIGLYQLRAGRSLIDLVDVNGTLGRAGGGAPGADARNMDHFCIFVEPFDESALRAHLETHGIDMGDVKSRYGAQGQGPSIYIQDPEGNTVELKGSGTA